MHNYMGFPGVAFIAGRTFQTEFGTHEYGTVVKDAPKFPNLDVLVSAGYLFPYSPDSGYEHLPAHLFSGTNLRSEIDALMEGDTTKGTVDQFPDGEKPEVIKQAEREAEQQNEIYERLKKAPVKLPGDDTRTQRPPAAVNKTATKTAAKKTAASTPKDEK